MKKVCFVIAAIAFLSGCVTGQTKEDVIDKVWEGAGGRRTWKDSRFLTFVFAPEKNGKILFRRSHLWDRYTGDYRFETKTPDNKSLLVLFNVNTQQGKSFINGKALSDTSNIAQVKKAYSYFVNDSYWLLAPLKLEDPGVNVTLLDPEEIEGVSLQILHLDFNKVGITPGDQYWLYVDPQSGEIRRWRFLLEGKKEPGEFNWVKYKDLGGGLRLSTRKENINQNNAITFPVASVLISVESEKFTKK